MSAHIFWRQFLVFSEWSLEALTIPSALALMIIFAVSLGFACRWQGPWRKNVWHWSHWLVFTQLLFFPATIAVGVLFPAVSGRPYPQENPAGGRWLDALFYLSLATGCFWVYRMKNLRWFAVSLVGLQEVLVLCAGFVAGMSVSGDWL